MLITGNGFSVLNISLFPFDSLTLLLMEQMKLTVISSSLKEEGMCTRVSPEQADTPISEGLSIRMFYRMICPIPFAKTMKFNNL